MESSIILLALFSSLILVIGVVLFLRNKIVKDLKLVLNFVFPRKEYPKANRLKIGIVRAMTFVIGIVFLIFLISLFFSVIQPVFLADAQSVVEAKVDIKPKDRGESDVKPVADQENKLTGPLGDLFNGIATPILTFMTFCGLLVTIIMQQLQLRMTLKEMKDSNEVLQKQLKNSEAEKFDNNFFSLLEMYVSISKEALLEVDYEGENLIKISVSQFCRERDDDEYQLINSSKFNKIILFNYQILKFIDKSCINEDEKDYYRGLIKSATDNSICVLIFIRLGHEDESYHKRLIEKSGFLEFMDLHGFFCSDKILKLIKKYAAIAYGNQEEICKYISASMISLTGDVFDKTMDDLLELRGKLGKFVHDYSNLLSGDLMENFSDINERINSYIQTMNKVGEFINAKRFLDDDEYAISVISEEWLYSSNEINIQSVIDFVGYWNNYLNAAEVQILFKGQVDA